MLGNKDANIAVTTTYVFDTREWMGPGGLHGLQIRWQAAFAVCGGFDSLALPPNCYSKYPLAAASRHRPPTALVQLKDSAANGVLAACGVPITLLTKSDGTALREAWRQFLHASVAPLALTVASALSGKLESLGLRLNFDRLFASDLSGPGPCVSIDGRRRYGCLESGGACRTLGG